MNNAKAQKRWEMIRRSAEAPLQRVLEGTHTPRDVDSLGVALKNYDDLAFSVFAEAIRVSEIQAQDRVQAVKDARAARDKEPLSAAALSKLYSKAADKTLKKAMPVIISEVREMLSLSGKELEDVEMPEQQKPVGPQAPLKLKSASLQNFKDQRAANEGFMRDLREVLGDTQESVLAGVKELANANLEAVNELRFSEVAAEPPSPAQRPFELVRPKDEPGVAEKAQTEVATPAQPQPETASPKSEKDEKDEKRRDTVVRRTLDFIKTKYGKLRSGMSKSSEFLSNALMIGMALAAIPPAIKGFLAAFDNVKILDIVKDTFNTIMGWIPNALSYICTKVMSFLGLGDLNKQPDVKNVDPGSGLDSRPVGERNYSWAEKTKDPNKVESKLSREEAIKYMMNTTFSDSEAQAFNEAHAKYKLKVPEERITYTSEDSEVRKPTHLAKMKEEAAVAREANTTKASPVATPVAKAVPSGSPAAPDGATGAGANMPKGDTEQAAPPKTVASGGLSASSPMPLSTPSKGDGGATQPQQPATRGPVAAQPKPEPAQPQAKPVTATPPPAQPQQQQTQQTQARSLQGTGESKLGIGSVPNHSANSEVSLFVNAVPAM